MKKLLSLAFLSIVVFSFSSCKKDEVTPVVVPDPPICTLPPPASPDYVGLWVARDSIGKMGIVFKADSYYMTFFLGDVLMNTSSGTLSVVGDLMTLTETEIGKLDMSNVMQTYKAGTAAYIGNGGDAAPDVIKFTIFDNKLTVMTDDNNDKVYGGAGDDVSMVFSEIKPSIDPF